MGFLKELWTTDRHRRPKTEDCVTEGLPSGMGGVPIAAALRGSASEIGDCRGGPSRDFTVGIRLILINKQITVEMEWRGTG